jgi:hypothetical protein
MTPESMDSLKSMIEADAALLAGESDAAIRGYLEAIHSAENAPAEDLLFDRELMIAYCDAGLSCAYAEREMFVESLASADRTTAVLGKQFNNTASIDVERLCMASSSKVFALIELERLDEAKAAFFDAKSILVKASVWSADGKRRFLELAVKLGVENA